MKKIPFLKCNNTEIYLDNNYQMNEDLYYIEYGNKTFGRCWTHNYYNYFI